MSGTFDVLVCNRCGAHHDRPEAGCVECRSTDYERIEVVPLSALVSDEVVAVAEAEYAKHERSALNAMKCALYAVAEALQEAEHD